MSKLGYRFLSVLVIGVAIFMLTLPLMAQQNEGDFEPIVSVSPVFWWFGEGDDAAIEDTEIVLTRMEHGISVSIDTNELESEEIYTVWWVIFNEPEKCSDGYCFFNDVFLMEGEDNYILDKNGRQQLNRINIDKVGISSMRATSGIADEEGRAMFRAHLPIGDTTDYMDFGNGLLYPMSAEIHVILRTHGPAMPDLLWEQQFTSWGGCPDPDNRVPCKNVQFTMFLSPE